jgi:hypothetical protein
LYESIDPTKSVPGFEFQDVKSTSGTERVVTTKVTASDGSTGQVERGYDPTTGRFVLHYADLESIPKPLRWVPTDPPMVPEKAGTPLEAYMTMRQMRILEGETGVSLEITGPRVFKLSTILNERTIAQVAKAVPRARPPSTALDQAVVNTHSVEYANNSIIQSGGRIASAHVEGGSMTPASSAGFGGISPEVMAEFGLGPSDPVLNGFNIILDVVPANAPNSPPKTPTPVVPTPIPVPDRDQDAGAQ